jgi:uncharacterized protein (TIGR00290 family)
MINIPVICSWSGGKDSCLALYRAIKQGYQIKYLLNFTSSETKRCCFHGLDSKLLQIQAESIGIPLIQQEMPNDMAGYEENFKSSVNKLKSEGIKGMVFGDIYLDEHKDWVERVCNDIGIIAIEPLWNQSPEDLIREFIDVGFKSEIISAKADLFSEESMGRIIDHNFVNELLQKKICPCGENGEFHTFVVDGPIFKKEIIIKESQSLLIDGFWKHWSLDIKQVETKMR